MEEFSSQRTHEIKHKNEIITALPTLFDFDNKLDFNSMDKLIKFQIDSGIQSIVVGGSTGELLLLEQDEYLELIKYICQKYSKQVNIIGCCTGASTSASLSLATKLKSIGIDTALCATPFYVKPSQEGIIKHYRQVSNIIKTIIYSVPSRTAVDMSLDTIKVLINMDNIIGYKDATSDLSRTLTLSKYIKNNNLNFKLFVGDDINYLGFSACGADGIISVISNFMPEEMIEIASYIDKGNFLQARECFYPILPIIKSLNLEANPIVIKYLLSKKFHGINYICRPPLDSINIDVKEACDNLLNKFSIVPHSSL